MANKFIVTIKEGHISFIMSRCVEFHRELVPKNFTGKVCGGGWFYFDPPNKRIVLYGKSEDYGKLDKHEVLTALKEAYLSQSLEGYSFYITSAEWLNEALLIVESAEPDYIHFNPITQ